MSFAYMTALELKRLLAAGSISPVELVEDTLARQEALEPQINAFVTATPAEALAAARDQERAYGTGEAGAIAGLPLSVKDLVAMAGVPWTFGSRPFADNVPDFDAPSVERIRAGRRLHRRQVRHQRVRLQGGLRQPAQRHHPQPLEPGEDAGRLQRRRGRERRRRAHAVCARHRRRRLGADSVGALRPLRHQGAVRPGAGVPGLGGADALPCGRARAHGARRRAAARRHGRPRPARCLRRRRGPCPTSSPPAMRAPGGCASPGARPSAMPRLSRRSPRSARPRRCASRRWAAPSSWSTTRSAPTRSTCGWRSSTAASAPG